MSTSSLQGAVQRRRNKTYYRCCVEGCRTTRGLYYYMLCFVWFMVGHCRYYKLHIRQMMLSIKLYFMKILFSDVSTHRFPNPQLNPIQMRKWMKLVRLEYMDPRTVYKNKRICGIHFSSDCFSLSTQRLISNSYPTLHLPAGIILFTFIMHS